MPNNSNFSLLSYLLGIATLTLVIIGADIFSNDTEMITDVKEDGSIEIRNAHIRLFPSSSNVIISGSGPDPNEIIYSLAGSLKSRGDSSVSIIKMDSEGAGLETQVKLLIGIRKDP